MYDHPPTNIDPENHDLLEETSLPTPKSLQGRCFGGWPLLPLKIQDDSYLSHFTPRTLFIHHLAPPTQSPTLLVKTHEKTP